MSPDASCRCDSGLHHRSCCGLAVAAPPPPGSLSLLVPYAQQAEHAHRSGATEIAERLCLDILELIPIERSALRVLYEIRKSQGRRVAAEALIRRLVAFNPNDFQTINELT